MKERWKRCWRGLLVDLLRIGGALAISAGVWSIYPPAGLIAGGILSLVGAWMAAPGGRGGEG